MATLVLGLGNLLMGDDSFGVRAAQALARRFHWPDGVRVVDGGTLGLDLLPQLEGVERLLIIDALDFGLEPGTLMRLEGEEVPRAFANKLSVHQMGLQDLLAVAELQGHLPQQVVVWGVQAGAVELEMELSPAVAAAFEPAIAAVVDELAAWQAVLQPV